MQNQAIMEIEKSQSVEHGAGVVPATFVAEPTPGQLDHRDDLGRTDLPGRLGEIATTPTPLVLSGLKRPEGAPQTHQGASPESLYDSEKLPELILEAVRAEGAAKISRLAYVVYGKTGLYHHGILDHEVFIQFRDTLDKMTADKLLVVTGRRYYRQAGTDSHTAAAARRPTQQTTPEEPPETASANSELEQLITTIRDLQETSHPMKGVHTSHDSRDRKRRRKP